MIRFENIFNDEHGGEELKSLLKWLGLQAKKEISNSVFNKKINKTNDDRLIWDKKCENIVEKYCSDLMLKYNYKA